VAETLSVTVKSASLFLSVSAILEESKELGRVEMFLYNYCLDLSKYCIL